MREWKTRDVDGGAAEGRGAVEEGGGMRGHPRLSNRDLQRRLAQRQAATQAATRSANARAFRESMKVFARSHIPGRLDKLRLLVLRAVADIVTGRVYDVDKYGTAELEALLSKVSSLVLGLAADVVGGMMLRSLGRLSQLEEVVPTKLELEPSLAPHEGAEAVRTLPHVKPDLGAKDPFSASLKLQEKGRLAIESLPRTGKIDLLSLMDRVFLGVSVLTDGYVEAICGAIDANVDDDFAATTWEAISRTVALGAGGEQQPSEAFVRTWMMAQLLGTPVDMVDTVESARTVLRTILVELRVEEEASTPWGRPAVDTAREATQRADQALDHAVIRSNEKPALERDQSNRRLMSLGVTRPESVQLGRSE